MLTKEQQEIRSKGIGSSEIAAVCGINPFMRPIDVYCRKLGLSDKVEGYNIDRGNFLEDGLIKWYEKKQCVKVMDSLTYIETSRPLCIATPDGIALYNDENRCLEIKSPARTQNHWGEPGTDEIPEYYLPQVMWEMAATKLKLCDVAALIYGDLHIYHVDYSEEQFNLLYEIAEKFWKDHILKQEPPAADGSVSYTKYLKKMYPRQSLDMIEASEEMKEVIMQYQLYKQGMDSLEMQTEALKNQLKGMIGDHEGIGGEWGKITWKEAKGKTSVDYEKLIDIMQIPKEKVEACKKIGEPSRRFLTDIKLEVPNV